MASSAVAQRKIAEWKVELEAIRKKHNGILRPADVVERAADPSSSLHGCFQWDEEKAAHAYRLWQAREIIAAVVSVLPGSDREYRVYVSMDEDREREGGGYRSLVSILSDAEKRRRLLDQALAEFDRWKERYEALVELAEVFEARKKIR